MSIEDLFLTLKARGNWGHKGRPGKRGGSSPKGGGGGSIEKDSMGRSTISSPGGHTISYGEYGPDSRGKPSIKISTSSEGVDIKGAKATSSALKKAASEVRKATGQSSNDSSVKPRVLQNDDRAIRLTEGFGNPEISYDKKSGKIFIPGTPGSGSGISADQADKQARLIDSLVSML